MSYKKLSHLIAAVAAASSMAAQPQPASSESDTHATAVSASPAAADLSGQLASAFSNQTPVANVSAQAQGANVKLAAVSSSNEILGAVRARKSNSGMQQTEVSEWVLVLIGAFLIWTMSQRRVRSILD